MLLDRDGSVHGASVGQSNHQPAKAGYRVFAARPTGNGDTVGSYYGALGHNHFGLFP